MCMYMHICVSVLIQCRKGGKNARKRTCDWLRSLLQCDAVRSQCDAVCSQGVAVCSQCAAVCSQCVHGVFTVNGEYIYIYIYICM